MARDVQGRGQERDSGLLFALTSFYNPFVHQIDVKTTFLNGNLFEEIYIEQPEGFVLRGNE